MERSTSEFSQFQNPIYKAKFFQGIQPKGREVHFEIQDGYIFISDPEKAQELSEWDPYLIKKHSYENQVLILKWGVRDPFEYLEIKEQNVIQILDTSYPEKKLLGGGGFSWESFTFLRIGIWIMALGMALMLVYFIMMPWIVRIGSNLVPIEWEKKWADQTEKSYIQSQEIDSLATIQMNRFYRALEHQSKYDIRIFVVNDSLVNAFAMPGGILVVNSAMLDKIKEYGQLVGLLGHELAHVEKRHSLQSILKSVGGVVILQFLVGGFDLFSGILFEQFRNLDQMAYSRTLEAEADQEAVEFCLRQGIHPDGIIGLFKILKEEESKHSVDVPSFLRTHPLTEDRIEQTSQLIENKRFRISDLRQNELENLFCELKEQ